MAKIIAFISVFFWIYNVSAQSTATSAPATTIKAESGDLDAEVSDAKLRADSGSKSRYSASLTLNYAGASARKPFDDVRPQIGRTTTPQPVSVSGGFGARYRFNKNESLYFATGYRKVLHGPDSEPDISNPSLTYNNTFAADQMQIGSSFTASVTTHEDEKKTGDVGTVSASISAIAPLNQSGLTGGVFGYVWYTHYRPGFELFEKYQIDYGASLGPMLTYRLNDKVNFYTQLKAATLTHVKANDAFDMDDSEITQSVGIGLAPWRDFYLAPYASFYWNQFSARKTAVNLSATLNIF